jgi:pimeloyl-ACP methyl ester carboxylesterase
MDKFVNINNQQVFYKTLGTGPTVVLLHGFGENGNIWQQQVEALAGSYHVIVPDLPGSGKSNLVEDMSIEGLAACVYQILQTEKVNLCVMIGHSMGGYITLAFAEKYPDVLTGFGLFHSTAYADTEEKKVTRQKGIQFIEKHGALEFLKTSTPNLFSPATKENNNTLLEEHLQQAAAFSKEALVAYYKAMIQRPDRTNVLQKVQVPVLFVLGEHDTAVPLKDGLEQCHLPSVSYVQILQQSGHMGMIEEAEKSTTILKEYLTIL